MSDKNGNIINYIDTMAFREAIARSGMTQRELEEESGVSQSHISKVLTGQRGISLIMFARLCKAIGKEPAEFLTEEGKKLLTYD